MDMAKPIIRFKGYQDDWEQRKLGDLTEELSEYATMASGLPLLTSSRSGLMYQSDFRDRKTTTSDETLFSIVPKGSCTYRHMSDDDIFHLNINVLEKGLVSREYPVFISSENNDLEFIIQHINSSDRFRAFCKGQKKGGTRTRLYYKTLCEFEMMIPSIEEQKKISATLHSLDYLITLHQRKCDETKRLKKYMLQKMFPQNGEKVPEIRFSGFTDDWEQRKLSELLVERNVQHSQSEEFPLVSFTVENGVTPKTERYEREQLVRGDKSAKKYKETRLDDIVYNPANLKFGAISRNKLGNAVFSPIYVTFEVKKDLVKPSFIEMVVTRKNFIQKALQYQQGTVYERMAVNTEDFTNLDVYIPNGFEQEKIGNYFENLDHLITLHQQKCFYNIYTFNQTKKL